MPSAKPLKMEDATSCYNIGAPQYFGPAVKYVQSPWEICEVIDLAIVRTTQVSKSPNPLSNPVDLNFPLNGVPHWMIETLACSSLMKEASKFSETLQEYRLGYENPMGEVSDLDLKQISLDLIFTKLQDVPYGS